MTKFGYPSGMTARDATPRFGATTRDATPRFGATTRDATPRFGATTGAITLPVPRIGQQNGIIGREYKPAAQAVQRKSERDKRWPLRGWDAERDKRWPLRGWDADDTAEDGISGWMKLQNLLESRKDTKKRSPRLDTEYYVSVKHECPSIENTETFHEGSLHANFHPTPSSTSDNYPTGVKLRYTNKNDAITQYGYEERELDNNGKIDYKDSKGGKRDDHLADRRSRSVQDLTKIQLERSNTCLKIKRLLKFSKADRRTTKADEYEDEGYSSKTSSAETKQEPVSDGEESGSEKQRMYCSMINLSELPSQADDTGNNGSGIRDARIIGESLASRIKFSYTHQPAILQLPDPEVKLAHDNVRIEKRIENEDTSWSYAKLKRSKELNRCYKPNILPQPEDSTVYNIDSMKPVTLVLRKISIQNADQNVPSVVQVSNHGNWEKSSSELPQTLLRNISGQGMNSIPRVGSGLSRDGSLSRTGSFKFGAISPVPVVMDSPVPGSVTPRTLSPQNNSTKHSNGSQNSVNKSSNAPLNDATKASNDSPSNLTKSSNGRKHTGGLQRAGSAVSQRELLNNLHRSNNVRDVRVVNDNKPKEQMWNQQYSYIDRLSLDRQATNYCFGDLLPAVDRSIYTNHSTKSIHTESDVTNDELTTAELLDLNITSVDDGFILLQKGIDLLTGSKEKPTLGPPPFRPNQTRHPLMRNVTVIIDNNHDSSPASGSARNKPVRVQSDKGPRPQYEDEDKETQKKLKEAFSKFYRNRPKEIGKEFRRMQTMWNT